MYKTDIFRSLANFEEQATLKDGQTVDRPYRSDIVIENYSKGTALTAQDLTAVSDTMTIDVIKAMLFYVDNVDKIQNKYSAVNLWADEAGRRLSNVLDAYFLYEVFNATTDVDEADISGGTDGYGITASITNVLDIFGKINENLDVYNIPEDDRYFAISPQFYTVLWKYIAGKASMLGDRTGENGNIGTYAGLKLYKTNNLTGSARWTPANNPSNGDTITINSITFTFVSTIGTTAGNILQTTSLAVTLDSLCALINAAGVGDEISYYSLSAANKRTVSNWYAYDGTTYLEIRVKGGSYVTVSGSDSDDVWTAQYQIQNLMAGRKGAVDGVIQKEPGVEMASTVSAGKAGVNVLPLTLFKFNTFYQGKNEMTRVMLRSDAY